MRKLVYILQAVILLTAFYSCNGEDNLEADIHDPNAFFEPKPSAQDEESAIRRQFKEKYGAYLLFNDTIQKNFLGFDINGDSVFKVETLSIDYTIGQTAYANNAYTYLYLSTIEEKKAAVDFLEQYVLGHVTNKLMPYSWMLCSQINYDDGSQHPYAAAGQRSIVVATGLVARLRTEAQKKQYVDRILNMILGTLVMNNYDAFSEFLNVSKGYFGIAITASSDDILRNYARQHGFVDIVNGLFNTTTPTEEEDLKLFCTYLLNFNDEYMESTFKDYPLVLRKWDLFKQVIYDLGFRN